MPRATIVLDLIRPRELALENLALRQQVASLASKPHSRRNGFDRIFWAAIPLSGLPGATLSILFALTPSFAGIAPDSASSGGGNPDASVGRPAIDKEMRYHVVKIATENPTWVAPRIHGELLELGFEVAQAIVAKYMPKHPRNRSPASPDGSTFLKLHLEGSVGIDFFDIPTGTFDVLHGFLVIDHKSASYSTWASPTILPPSGPPTNLLPRFRQFHAGSPIPRPRRNHWFDLCRESQGIGIEHHISAPRSPWQNPFAERVIGSIRRDLLDHVIVLNERHATMLLREYQKTCYNPCRTHLGLEKGTPTGRRAQSPAGGAEIVSIPILGGLHHRYERRRHAA